ncbi:hypothetical protein [Serratia sp. (in: enterobacteria)]|uniref:DUF7352 domain-containing protein n=1 Tax=Serratia sp. (in: enterobacteria) TaxID=616 RepID=UPI00398909C5
MSKTIFKYKWADTVQVPIGAEILHADFQGTDLMFWALVDPDAELESRTLILVPTGHITVPDELNMRYINTVFQGQYVWHLFEESK